MLAIQVSTIDLSGLKNPYFAIADQELDHISYLLPPRYQMLCNDKAGIIVVLGYRHYNEKREEEKE